MGIIGDGHWLNIYPTIGRPFGENSIGCVDPRAFYPFYDYVRVFSIVLTEHICLLYTDGFNEYERTNLPDVCDGASGQRGYGYNCQFG